MKVLRERRDVQSVAYVLLALSLLTAGWLGLTAGVPALAATAFACFLACVVNHNHQHHPTFRSRGADRAFGVSLALATGQPATAIVPMHVDNHHAFAGGPEDFVRPSIVNTPSNLLNVAVFPFVALAGYARQKRAGLERFRLRKPELYRRLVLERRVLYPLLGLILVIDPVATLVAVVLPWIVGQWAIVAINHFQHQGCEPDDPHACARNVTGRIANFLFLNNGFHTAHHLWPGLHWSRLPRAHARIEREIPTDLRRRSFVLAALERYVLGRYVLRKDSIS